MLFLSEIDDYCFSIKLLTHIFCFVQYEFEPEYIVEFNRNPDIDEKPPIPLKETLEKMKPFLMEYEGIKSQEEWEVHLTCLLLHFVILKLMIQLKKKIFPLSLVLVVV